jgi:hypothetical protein
VTATIGVGRETTCVSPARAGIWVTTGRQLQRIAGNRIAGKPLTVSDGDLSCVRGDTSALWVTTLNRGVVQRIAVGPGR